MARLTLSPPVAVAVAAGKLLTINNSLTLKGTDGTTMMFPGTSDTVAGLGTVQTFIAAQMMTGGLTITSNTVTTGTGFAWSSSSLTNGDFLTITVSTGGTFGGFFLKLINVATTKFSVDFAGDVTQAGSLTIGGVLALDLAAGGVGATLHMSSLATGSATSAAVIGKIPAGQTQTAQSQWVLVQISGATYRLPAWINS